MNHKIIKLSRHNRLILQKDKKFKYIGIEIVFKTKFQYENITAFRLLSKILANSNASYPSIESIGKRKDELYDLELGFSHSYSGKLSLLKFHCSYVNPQFIADKDYEDHVLALLYECIFNPYLKNGHFDESLFAIAKDLVINDILTQKDNPTRYLMMTLFSLVGNKKQAISASSYGDKNVLKRLNSKNLVDFYHKMIESPFDIYVVGDIQFAKLEEKLKKYFYHESINKRFYSPAIALNNQLIEPKMIYQEMNQARIAMLYTTNIVFSDKQSYVVRILNDILGGGMQSKLFLEIREKKGLCYSITSSYNASYGYILIYTGVPLSKVDETIQAIKQQIDLIQKGHITEHEIKRSVETFKRNLFSQQDDMFSYLDLHIRYASFKQKFDLNEIIKEYDKITKEDILEVAQMLNYKTHVVLTTKDE